MRYIVQGSQTQERLDWLLKLTRIASEDVITALRLHLVTGLAESTAALVADVKLSNLKRALDTLNETAEAVEKIKEIDWRSFRSLK
jgi:hypothetical protein